MRSKAHLLLLAFYYQQIVLDLVQKMHLSFGNYSFQPRHYSSQAHASRHIMYQGSYAQRPYGMGTSNVCVYLILLLAILESLSFSA